MKRRLQGLHLLNQFLDPIKHSLVGDFGCQALIMVNLAVQLDALFAHGLTSPISQATKPPVKERRWQRHLVSRDADELKSRRRGWDIGDGFFTWA
jgi:hypothetical protein